jgi:hypothetical protein
MMVEPPIAFLPALSLLAPQLFAKVFAHERVRVEVPRAMWIFAREEPCSS